MSSVRIRFYGRVVLYKSLIKTQAPRCNIYLVACPGDHDGIHAPLFCIAARRYSTVFGHPYRITRQGHGIPHTHVAGLYTRLLSLRRIVINQPCASLCLFAAKSFVTEQMTQRHTQTETHARHPHPVSGTKQRMLAIGRYNDYHADERMYEHDQEKGGRQSQYPFFAPFQCCYLILSTQRKIRFQRIRPSNRPRSLSSDNQISIGLPTIWSSGTKPQ